jgi:hypothetical protein
MGACENNISNLIMIEASIRSGRLFRNNVGATKTIDGRFLEFGLCPGSSDLIGWMPIIVTQEMIGKKIAVFTAIEVKTSEGMARKNNKTWDRQEKFINLVNDHGGIAARCISTSDFVNIIDGWG